MHNVRLITTGGILAALAGIGFIVPDADMVPGTAPDAGTTAAAAVPTAPARASSVPPVLIPSALNAALDAALDPSSAESMGDAGRDDARERAPALATFNGSASYYADKFEGRTTASGVPFRQARMWAAHKTLPFGTRLRVTNVANGNEVEVEVVDRGPYAHGRVLDLSKTAAKRLDFLRAGHTRVKIEVLERP